MSLLLLLRTQAAHDPRAHGRGVRPGRRGCSSRGPPAHGRCRQWPRNHHREAGAASSRWRAWLLAAGPSPARSGWPAPCVGSRRRPVRWPRAWRSSGGWPESPQDRPPLAHGWPVSRPLAGEASGTSTVLGRASCVRSLAGVAAGWSRVSGFMLSRSGRPPAARCASGGRRGPSGPLSKTAARRYGPRRASSCPPQRTGPSHPRTEHRSIDA